MKRHALLTLVLILGVQFGTFALRADDQADLIKQLLKRVEELEQRVKAFEGIKDPGSKMNDDAAQRRIQELDQKLKILERNHELDREASVDAARAATAVSEGSTGFVVRSPDSNFTLKVRGYIQTDARFFPDDNPGGTTNDSFLLRRVRPIIEGTVYHKYDYRLMLDFGQNKVSGSSAGNQDVVQDAYVTARLWPEFQIQAGKFKEPVGLERLQSGANLLFAERAYPTQLVPNRDVGFQVQGDLFGGALNYAAGVFNGVADGGSGDFETSDDEKDFASRLFTQPFLNSNSDWLRGLGFGIAGTFGNQEGALRNLVSPGQQKFFSYRTGAGTNAVTANVVADGDHWRLVPQLYYYYGPFGILGEYVFSSQKIRRDAGGAPAFATVKNTAWQVAGSWFLTGEDNSFKAVNPRKPFVLGGEGWGAWELTARLSGLDVDNAAFPLYANPATSARSALSWGVGVNWHLNKNIKATANYEQTNFKGGDGNPFAAKGEKAVLSRVQFSF